MPILGIILLLATGAVIGGLVSLMFVEARQPQPLIVGALALAVLLLVPILF